MSEQFDLYDWPELLLTRSIILSGKKEEIKKSQVSPGKHEIKLTADGIEVPFVEAVDTLKQYMKEQITKGAIEIVKTKFHDIVDYMINLETEIEVIAGERIGIKIERDC